MKTRRLTLAEWHAEATELFGPDPNTWRFRCPSCGHVQTRQDFLDLGMHVMMADKIVGFSCVGRWRPRCVEAFQNDEGDGCNFMGGGEVNFSPIQLIIQEGEERPTFGFARNE